MRLSVIWIVSKLISLQGVCAVTVLGVSSLLDCRRRLEKHYPRSWRFSHIALSIVILLSLTWPSTIIMRILDAVATCLLALEMFIAFARRTTGRLLDNGWPCYKTTLAKFSVDKPYPYHTSYCFYWIQGKPVQAWYSEHSGAFLIYDLAAESTAFFEGPFGPAFGLLSVLNRSIRSRQVSSRRYHPTLIPEQNLNIWSDLSGWPRAFSLYQECCTLKFDVSLYVVVNGEQTAKHIEEVWKQMREPGDKGLKGCRTEEERNVSDVITKSLSGRCDVGEFLESFPWGFDIDS